MVTSWFVLRRLSNQLLLIYLKWQPACLVHIFGRVKANLIVVHKKPTIRIRTRAWVIHFTVLCTGAKWKRRDIRIDRFTSEWENIDHWIIAHTGRGKGVLITTFQCYLVEPNFGFDLRYVDFSMQFNLIVWLNILWQDFETNLHNGQIYTVLRRLFRTWKTSRTGWLCTLECTKFPPFGASLGQI